MWELKQTLQKSNNSATGPDEVYYNLLTPLPESVLSVLLKVYNSIWDSETFPASWREAIMVPIAKTGKDPKNPTNYRPIALTSCLCKTMERMVNARLMWCLESEGHLSDVQCGFRKNRSTVDHLARFESFVREAFIKKEHAAVIFFFSIWRRRMTPPGSTAYYKTYMNLVFEVDCRASSAISSPIVYFK